MSINNMDDLDVLNHFSLDMVSTDMNFEQVYSMYNHLQQENALNAIENLQKIQSLNNPHVSHSNNSQIPRNESFNFGDVEMSMNTADQSDEDNVDDDEEEEEDDEEEEEEEEEEEDYDKFFSNTESNALENFLDSLANPTNSNPLELYHHDFNFKPQVQHKTDLANAFSHPPSSSTFKTSISMDSTNDSSLNTQLPTPESRQSSIDEEYDMKKSLSMSDYDDESPRKKKKPTTKPLLSLEQKRLNHSHSEQKRRQLCKLAYERCLRLITNFESYSKQPPVNRKSKRRQFTKDGLPNLSKHCALMKISNEIISIKTKNDQLKQLLKMNGVV